MKGTAGRARRKRFAVCVSRGSYKHSLELRKIYRMLDDPAAEGLSLVRVIDESGEDYLYPAGFFVPIALPLRAEPAFARAVAARAGRLRSRSLEKKVLPTASR
jgi:hypothetical protein